MQTNNFTKRFKLALLALFTSVSLIAAVPAIVSAQAAPAAAPAKNATCDPKTQYCTPFYDDQRYKTAQSSHQGNDILTTYVKPAVAALSALAGITVTGSIIFAAILYTTAGGDSSKVSAAKQRILQAIIILVVYIFFYAFMRFMLPGANL